VDLDAVTTENTKRYSHTVPSPGTIFTRLSDIWRGPRHTTPTLGQGIAEDFFEQFDRANLLGGQAPMYRRAVLGRGTGQRPGEELPGSSAEYDSLPEVMAEEFEGEKVAVRFCELFRAPDVVNYMLQDLRFDSSFSGKKGIHRDSSIDAGIVHRRQYGDLHGAACGDSGAAAVRRA
jgi:hypothetical protein